MPDSLAHVLVAYIVFQIAAWRISRLERSDVAVAVVGSLIPDAAKFNLVVPSQAVENIIGVPFSWEGLSTPWGVLALAGIGSLLVATERRQRVFVILVLGALFHEVLDSMNRMPGETRFDTHDIVLNPIDPVLEALPDLYISGDYWPTMLALGVSVVVLVVERRRRVRGRE